MKTKRGQRSTAVRRAGCGMAGILAVASVHAADEDPAAEVERLRRKLDEQTRQMEVLRDSLDRQEAALQALRRELDVSGLRGRGAETPAAGGTPPASPAQPPAVAQAPAQTPKPVGQAPAREQISRPPEVATIFEQPGVLTPPGKWIVEPSLQYAYSSSNRIALVGYTIIPALLIGLIDVREVKRNTLTAALTFRRGITNRFELEAKVPYVYRSDTSVGRRIVSGEAVDSVFDADGYGLGDIEFTGRYQLNDGGMDRPFYIASLRFKTRTGKDPFEVEIDRTSAITSGTGLQTELPTGSGFYTLQPGLTVLFPSDPAVFFGGVNYQYNFKRDGIKQETTDGEETIGEVEPGGVFGFNFGMGLALNERSSFSLGYEHLSVGKIKQNGRTLRTSVRTQLGTLLMGYSYRLDARRTLNVSLGAGLTRDTPDLQLTVRMPMSF